MSKNNNYDFLNDKEIKPISFLLGSTSIVLALSIFTAGIEGTFKLLSDAEKDIFFKYGGLTTTDSVDLEDSKVYYEFNSLDENGKALTTRVAKQNLSDVLRNDTGDVLIYDREKSADGKVKNLLTGETVSLEDNYKYVNCDLNEYVINKDYYTEQDYTNMDFDDIDKIVYVEEVISLDTESMINNLKTSKTLVRK